VDCGPLGGHLLVLAVTIDDDRDVIDDLGGAGTTTVSSGEGPRLLVPRFGSSVLLASR
jgi:hypothetical protein